MAGDGRTSAQINRNYFSSSDFIPNEFQIGDDLYKICSFIDHRAKTGQTICFNEPVKMTSITRLQRRRIDENPSTINQFDVEENEDERDRTVISTHGNLFRTELLMFNLGRELILYEFPEMTQAHFAEPVDYRVYRPTHPITCHDLSERVEQNSLHILAGFSNGQIQYIDLETKEQKIFNENSYLDKTKVTCIKWLSHPRTYFAASFASGSLYIFDEELNHQRDLNVQPVYSTMKDEEKNYSISYIKQKTKPVRNPLARWSIGQGALNEFAFSPDQKYLAFVSQDGFLRIFHYEKMQLVGYMKSYFGGLLCLCWSPDGRYIATGGEDDLISIFAFQTDDQISRVVCRGYGHTSWINAIAFDPYLSSRLSSDIPGKTVFYRFASVGQDNRLCFWELTEEVFHPSAGETGRCQMNSTSSYPVISTIFNGCSSFLSDTTSLLTSNSPLSTTKSSFSSLTSRLIFARSGSKSSVENSSTRSSVKKTRKLSLLHLNGTNSAAIAPAIESPSPSRRSHHDLTKTIFGTNLCPRLEEIPMIEPIVNEIIAYERLNGIFFSETFLLTSSQDGIIAVWEKLNKG